MIVGLTGGIASGKTTVSDYLIKLNIPLIDADLLARNVLASGSKGLSLIVEAFGRDFIEDGELNRKKLRKLVFSDALALKKLNEITHPLIREKIVDAIDSYKEANVKIAVLDAPLLLENNLEYLVDEVWLVAVEEDIQLNRLMLRDNISRDDAIKIMKKQMSLKDKIKKADLVLDNNLSVEKLLNQVDNYLELRDCLC